MIRKLITRFFHGKSFRIPAGKQGKPSLIEARNCKLRASDISPGSLKTVLGLQKAGYKAYVVGGAVRDLLLGLRPKDFDVATDATPAEVRSTFRRSRIIGRRFQIVHVYMGGEIVEVTTFRGQHAAKTDSHGRVLQDNNFGNQAEDAARRDFTVNALYYDPGKEVVVDYFRGVADIRQRRLRVIGEPARRYREDPVRMLRALRLSAKLGMQIDDASLQQIGTLAPLLDNVPSARCFDELLKFLTSGSSLEALNTLRAHRLHLRLLPELDDLFVEQASRSFIELALSKSDLRIAAGKTVSVTFILAALFWWKVLALWHKQREAGERNMPAMFSAIEEVLRQQSASLAISRRIAGEVKEIWSMQARFEQRSGKRPYALLDRPRFRAAYNLLSLRAEAGEASAELAGWWERFQSANTGEREKLLASLASGSHGAKHAGGRARRRRKKGDALASDRYNKRKRPAHGEFS